MTESSHANALDSVGVDKYDARESPPSPPPHVSLPQLLTYLLSKFLLEVCGAAGAVWGFCEICKWRHAENTDDFRSIVSVAFVIFAGRFYRNARYFWRHGHELEYVKLRDRRSHWCHLLKMFAAKWVLQVWGAAGAVWGASETLGLRDAQNRERWREVAWEVTYLFALRWSLQLYSYCFASRDPWGRSHEWHGCTYVTASMVEATVVKFVLEVCGSTGAVWGFADILTLRDKTPDSAAGWRIIALGIGGGFWLRWMLQVQEYLLLGHEDPLITESSRKLFISEEENDEGEDEEVGTLTGKQDDNVTYGSTTASEADLLLSSSGSQEAE